MEITNNAPFIVKLLVDGGPAHKTNQIQIGDTLVEINDTDVWCLHERWGAGVEYHFQEI